MGNGSTIRPGEIQHMRAGSGVVHSEYNPSAAEPTHFLQIWIVPGARGLTPAYGQYRFDQDRAAREFVLLASPEGRSDSVALQQDVDLWVTHLSGPATRRNSSCPSRPLRSTTLSNLRGLLTSTRR